MTTKIISVSPTQSAIQVNDVDKLLINSNGNIDLVGGKIVGAGQSMVRLNTANGYGSTNTRIRRFTTTVSNVGGDITYTDSATLGATFTVNTSGVYAVSFTDQFNAADVALITLNDTAPTSTPLLAEILAAGSGTAANAVAFAGWTGYLAAGSVIRARSFFGNPTGLTTTCNQFTMTRVG
jgi:hypothetical protein